MKRKLYPVTALLVLFSNCLFAQWAGSTDINGNIYRNGNIGIGTDISAGHISFGQMGNHLTIGNTGFLSPVILASGWNGINGDHTDIRVPGAVQNSAQLRLQQNGNMGLNTGASPILERFQIGSRFLFHDGGAKKICYNAWYDGNGGVLKRVDAAPIAEMGFSAFGEIFFGIAPTGAANSVVDNYQHALFITNSGNIGMGTITPGSFKLAVEGRIGAREVKVTNAAWADYVFSKQYKLRSLNSLEQYIQQHKHLPGIPSAAEVEKDGGIELGKMNVKLLEKIEELTLYVIELKKENEQIKKQLAERK